MFQALFQATTASQDVHPSRLLLLQDVLGRHQCDRKRCGLHAGPWVDGNAVGGLVDSVTRCLIQDLRAAEGDVFICFPL